MFGKQTNGDKIKERPSVETDGLNDCLPYEKKDDENVLRQSSNSFNNDVSTLY
jgi:hypothetical protein